MNRWSEKKQKNRIKTQFGKNPMDMETWESLQLRMHEIEMYEQRRRKDSNQEWVDDVTWNDLEMDRVFARINHTRTYMGEQILYYRFRGCKNRQELQRMEKRIAFFSCQESSRIKVEEKLSHIGKQKENYYLPLYDIVAFCHIEKALRKCRKETLQLYEFVGDVDTDIAIVSFRKSLKNWCSPMIQKSGSIRLEEICHPLMDDGVANSIELQKGAIFTGANASGKSTFMKAVAINVILAQTIHTCVAKNVKMPTIKVMTSMALRDDVVQKESYYMREMEYLKRMLDEIEKGEPVLFVIDEILKGTNTRERLGASKAILLYMAQNRDFCWSQRMIWN